jgi:hypothetical protein
MKKLNSLSMTVSALALIIAAPNLAAAKSPTHVAHTIDRTKSGQIDTTKNGMGTYTTTVTGTKNDKIVTTTYDFDGKTHTTTSNDVTTVNANGSLTHDDTITLGNGKTVNRDMTLTNTGTTGDYTVTGTVTQANGKVDIVSGSKDATIYGTNTALTYTNSADKTKTVDDEMLKSGDAIANVVTGTGFKGQTISYASLRITGAPQTTDAVDTTVDGQGSMTVSSNTVNGTTTRTADRNFADGATNQYTTATTVNGNGTTTVDGSTSYVSANGQASSSSFAETETSNGNNGYNIAGTFSQSNGYGGTLAGNNSHTNYGNVTDTTYAASNGAIKTAQTQQLVIGNAVLNVNTGTTFTGTPNNSVGLVTTASAQ